MIMQISNFGYFIPVLWNATKDMHLITLRRKQTNAFFESFGGYILRKVVFCDQYYCARSLIRRIN